MAATPYIRVHLEGCKYPVDLLNTKPRDQPSFRDAHCIVIEVLGNNRSRQILQENSWGILSNLGRSLVISERVDHLA